MFIDAYFVNTMNEISTGTLRLPKFDVRQVRAFLDRFGEQLPTGLGKVSSVKGQMLALAATSRRPKHVVRLGGGVYVAPKARWTLVGATTEWDRSDTDVDAAMLARLRDRAVGVISGLANAEEMASWAGLRPGVQDGLPMIGETRIPGLFAALGHLRNGVLLAPGTADLLTEMMIDGNVSALAERFSPLRFDKPDPAPHSP